MKGKKIILLILALLLPACIFLMLKMFGKNQFDVTPLFTEEIPELSSECAQRKIAVPYHIPDSVLNRLPFNSDSLLCIHFDDGSAEANDQLQRVVEQFGNDPLQVTSSNSLTNSNWRQCIFFLKEPFNVVVVDRKGRIRGQYEAEDRDEIDRLITEVTILLKKY